MSLLNSPLYSQYLVSDMANILLLLLIFMFVFAVIGVSLFAEYSPQHFGSLETGILFVQLLVGNKWSISEC